MQNIMSAQQLWANYKELENYKQKYLWMQYVEEICKDEKFVGSHESGYHVFVGNFIDRCDEPLNQTKELADNWDGIITQLSNIFPGIDQGNFLMLVLFVKDYVDDIYNPTKRIETADVKLRKLRDALKEELENYGGPKVQFKFSRGKKGQTIDLSDLEILEWLYDALIHSGEVNSIEIQQKDENNTNKEKISYKQFTAFKLFYRFLKLHIDKISEKKIKEIISRILYLIGYVNDINYSDGDANIYENIKHINLRREFDEQKMHIRHIYKCIFEDDRGNSW